LYKSFFVSLLAVELVGQNPCAKQKIFVHLSGV